MDNDLILYRGYEIHKSEIKRKFKYIIMKDDSLVEVINGLNYQVTLNLAKDYIDKLIDGDDYAE